MRNFMSYDRRWLDEPHIGDHVGRSVWALGEILATAWIPAVVEPTRDLLDRLVGGLDGEVSLRTAAYTVLGLSRLDADRLEPTVAAPARAASSNSSRARTNATRRTTGSWFEDKLSYDNARLSQALISGGSALGRDDLVEAGLESLRWLGDECGLADGTAPPARPSRATPRASRSGRRATSSRSMQRRSSRPSSPRSRSRTSPSTASARAARSNGSSDATASIARSTTSRPAAAATGSEPTTLNANEGAESTLAFHRAALLLDDAGVRRPFASRSLAA